MRNRNWNPSRLQLSPPSSIACTSCRQYAWWLLKPARSERPHLGWWSNHPSCEASEIQFCVRCSRRVLSHSFHLHFPKSPPGPPSPPSRNDQSSKSPCQSWEKLDRGPPLDPSSSKPYVVWLHLPGPLPLLLHTWSTPQSPRPPSSAVVRMP